MIQTIVERIYIVDKDDERFCHIFIKGCMDEDYTGFFQTAGYIEQNTTPVCDSEQYCIFHDATFPAFHIGNRLLVRRDELLDWLEQQKVNKAQNENPKIVGSDE